jgi:hypothetical protein
MAIRKSSVVKKKVAVKPVRGKKAAAGAADCPDERRPETKADEIYGDTKIPESHRKR